MKGSGFRREPARAARRLLPLVLAAALGGAGSAVLGCGRQAGRTPDVPAGTPVVLISIDTLRADHLPAYGYRGVDTPAIDALRADAILFARAYTQTPLTLPSHTALLTGLLPAMTGVRDNVGYTLDAARVASGDLPYLPFLLKQHGYATGGAVSASVLQGKTGLASGFDLYEDSIEFRTSTGLSGLQRPGAETLRLVLPWLRAAAAPPARPFFLFFHIYEPHTPYEPPEPYASRYPLKYDGEIATADAIVGRLLDELKRAGVYDRAIVVLLSDHGEGLGDHGEEEHGVLLYNEAIHVPLLLKLPRRQLAGRTAGAPAALTDVAPTLVRLLGLPVPPKMHGASLLGDERGVPRQATGGAAAFLGPDDRLQDRRVYSETFYPRLHFGWSDLASLVGPRYHVIEGPDPEIYDLQRDPRETRNLLRDERRLYADARRELAGYDRRLAPPAAVDAETRAAMAALGYVGRTAAGGGAAAGPLPDPKAHLDALKDLKQGFAAMAHHDYRLAGATFERLLARNPQMADAWEFLGRAREKLDDRRGALAAYDKALRIDQGSAPVAMAAAGVYFDLGQLDQAETHARIAAAGSPSFAHGLLAEIALRRGKLEEAEREARAALDDKGRRIRPLIILAAVLHARHRYEDALEQVRQAESAYAGRSTQDPDLIQGLALIHGKVLADLGDATGAEAAFRQEIQRFPADPPAYANLAILEALTGRPEAARDTLERMVDAHPSAAAYAEAVKTLRVLSDPRGAAALLRFALRKYPNDPELLRAASPPAAPGGHA
jgi:choline-sulfatase